MQKPGQDPVAKDDVPWWMKYAGRGLGTVGSISKFARSCVTIRCSFHAIRCGKNISCFISTNFYTIVITIISARYSAQTHPLPRYSLSLFLPPSLVSLSLDNNFSIDENEQFIQILFHSYSCDISRSLELCVYTVWSYRLFDQRHVANDSWFLSRNGRSAVLLSIHRLCTEFKRLGGEKAILEQSGCLLRVRTFDTFLICLTVDKILKFVHIAVTIRSMG